MNVFYFCSDLFACVAAVSIASLLENNSNMDEINFYVVDDGVSDENKEKLSNLVKVYERNMYFIEAPDPSDFFEFPLNSRYQIGHSYMRMCVGSLLPVDVDRVLCLDSDTLILGSLQQLWEINMGDNILAGVSDCINLSAYRRQFNLEENEIYCNAGMFLVDLKKWREENIERKIIDDIHKNNGNVFFFEQTLMNYSCKGKILRLPPIYNAYTLFYAFDYDNLLIWRRPQNFYSKEDVEKAKISPVIIHFTRNFYMTSRPWVKGCEHPITDTYIKYKKLTQWNELDDDTRSTKAKLKHNVWHIIPQRILAVLACTVYNGIRPNMFWKNE